MSKKEKKPKDHGKNSSEKDTNLNSDLQKRYLQDSPNSDDIDKDKPIHFKVEYEQNKKSCIKEWYSHISVPIPCNLKILRVHFCQE